MSGRFETKTESFQAEVQKSGEGASVIWDLKPVVPDLFIGSDQISRTLNQFWRPVLDKALENANGGHYAFLKGSQIQVFFKQTNETGAKAKLDIASTHLKEWVKNGGPVETESKPVASGAAKPEAESALSKIIKEGLADNATIREFNLWAERIIQFYHSDNSVNVVSPDLLKEATKFNFGFDPLWNTPSQTITGNVAMVGAAASMSGDALDMRRNIVMLTIACMEAIRLSKDNQQTLLIVPINVKHLREQSFFDLYAAILRPVKNVTSKLVVFELEGLPPGPMSPQVKEKVMLITSCGKGCFVNTGLLDFSRLLLESADIPVHSYGFNMGKGMKALSEDDVCISMKKYSKARKEQKVRCYMRGAKSASLFKTAVDSGFTFISGSIICPAQKRCIPLKKVPLESILSRAI